MRGNFRRNDPDHLARGRSEPRVARMSQARGAIPLRVRASRSPELRRFRRRNGQEHLACSISEPRVALMSHAKCARVPQVKACSSPEFQGRRLPLAQHVCAESCEDVSGESGWTTSRVTCRSPELRGRLRRNGHDRLSRSISERRVMMSQAKSELRGCPRRKGPDHFTCGISEPRVARMSQAKRS